MIPGWDEESSIETSKFSEAQIAFVLKQAEDSTAVGEVCRKWATRSRSGSTRARSSSPAIST
jgi:putative transposase